jgi:hypothetical protein
MILVLLENMIAIELENVKKHSDNYNQMWAEGCGNAVLTAEECGDLQSYIVYIGNV